MKCLLSKGPLVLVLIAFIVHGCNLKEKLIDFSSDISGVFQAIYDPEVFVFYIDSTGFFSKNYQTYSGAYSREFVIAGYKNNDPKDSLCIGCLDLYDWQYSDVWKDYNAPFVSQLILRLPGKDVALDTDIILEPRNQYVYIHGYYDPIEKMYFGVYDTIVESGKIHFTPVGDEYSMIERKFDLIEGTFELCVSYKILYNDGESSERITFTTKDGFFHAYLTEGDYR